MAYDGENLQEDQTGSNETQSKPIKEENVNENLLSTSKAENLQEDQRRRNWERSRSIEETKGPNQDLILSISGMIGSRSKAQKKDKEDSGFGVNREAQSRRYYGESSNAETRENLQQQRHEEMDIPPDSRRSQSRFRYDESPQDYRRSEYEWRDYEKSLLEYRMNEPKWRYDEKTHRRFERLPSGAYIVHPGKNDCNSYFRTGICPYRTTCKFNHPTTLPQELPERTNVPVCKFFVRGRCKKGLNCVFQHIMDSGGAEPMRRDSSTDRVASESEWESDERSINQRVSDNESITEQRYEPASRYMPEKKSQSRTIPDSRLRDPRGTFEDISQRRHEIEQERSVNKEIESPENPFMAAQRERERREAQENNAGGRIINLSHLINPIAKAWRERKRKREIEWLSREESPNGSSQQSNSTK